MKKLLPFLIVVFLFPFLIREAKAQNTYDPYVDFDIVPPPVINTPTNPFPTLYTSSGYSGEYQIHFRTTFSDFNHWATIANYDPAMMDLSKDYFLSYKIELVSFPFAPKHSASSALQRTLGVLENGTYDVLQCWVSPGLILHLKS